MTKSNEKVTPEVIEFSVTEVEKEFDKQYGKKAKKAGEYYYPIARAIYNKVVNAVKSKSGLSKKEVKELYTSMAVNKTPNKYPELELVGNMLKIDGNKAGIKYLQDCVNMAGLNAFSDELDDYYYKKPEHRRSLQNGGLGENDKFLSMKMLPVLKVKGGNGNKEKETTVTHLLPSITGTDIAITENSSDNWFYSLEKDSKTKCFIESWNMAKLPEEEQLTISELDCEFWIEVKECKKALAMKCSSLQAYRDYIAKNSKTGTDKK